MRLAILQHVHDAGEVVLEELAAAGIAREPCQYARIGGGVDHPVGGRQDFEIAGLTDIALDELHAALPQTNAIEFRPRTMQIIDAGDAQSFAAFEESLGDRRPGEAADAGDQTFMRTAFAEASPSNCRRFPGKYAAAAY